MEQGERSRSGTSRSGLRGINDLQSYLDQIASQTDAERKLGRCCSIEDWLETVASIWTPERLAWHRESLIEERGARASLEAITALWAGSYPKRHLAKVEEIERSYGDASDSWRLSFDALKTRIGTGFLGLLLGDNGVGKTQMACHLAKIAAENYVASILEGSPWPPSGAFDNCVIYRHAASIFNELKDFKSKKGIRRFVDPAFLTIDQLHQRQGTEWEGIQLTDLLDKRYEDQVDTLLITNLDEHKTQEALGRDIWSRLQETGGIYRCEWEPYR